MLISFGNWKGNFKDNLALAAYRSQVISIIEYGIAVYDPCGAKEDISRKLAKKVDVFINRHLRIMLGMPMYLPVEDMRDMFQYSLFYARWTALRARFYNHLSSCQNTPELIQYDHTCRWTFAIPKGLVLMLEKDKSLRSFFLRLYPKPNSSSTCSNCNEHHAQVNHVMQCYLKKQNILKKKRDYDHPVSDPAWKTKATAIQNELIQNGMFNTIHVTCDASFEADRNNIGHSNIGVIMVTHNTVKKQRFQATHLIIKDSTRAETAGIVSVCKQFTNKHLMIHCDNKPAIRACHQYMTYEENRTNFQRINNCDIIAQGNWFTNTVELFWVPGHANNLLNIECDLMAKLWNTNYPDVDILLQSNMEVTTNPHNPAYFRIKDVFYAEERNRLLPRFTTLKNRCQLELKRLSLDPPTIVDVKTVPFMVTDDEETPELEVG